jgi:hypothetical protein
MDRQMLGIFNNIANLELEFWMRIPSAMLSDLMLREGFHMGEFSIGSQFGLLNL